MSVRKKDRHQANDEPLEFSRRLTHQALILTHAREFNEKGEQIRRPGILAEGQPFFAFGKDCLDLSKRIHAKCYEALSIKLKDEESLKQRTELHKQAVEYCKSILRLMDLCIYEYGESNKKKRRSFIYFSTLTYNTMKSIQDRMNRDKLIYEHNYHPVRHYRRGR